jgi:hypothetical protein
MKKRILLSLVAFFAMTAMWASIIEAYKITVEGANGKTFNTAELTLKMDNRNAINSWSCVLQLPEGVTFKSAEVNPSRYPVGIEIEINAVPSNDNSVAISCELPEGVSLTGTAGAVAVVTVEIAGTVEPGDYDVTLLADQTKLVEVDGTIHTYPKDVVFKWTIEEGEDPNPGVTGDLNEDGSVDIADAITVLNIMAAGEYNEKADLNKDQVVDIADFISVLNIMATGAE